MSITIAEANDGDMKEMFTIASRAFARNEPFWCAMFPEHWTEAGRVVGGERFLALRKSDPNVHYIKAVDPRTGRIAGFARWVIWDKRFPEPSGSDHGPYWTDPEVADWFHVMLLEFLKTRHGHIEQEQGSAVSLDICTVDPDFQRRGVGDKLVQWGTNKADEMKVDAFVESSKPGRGLYEKHGFVWQKDVDIPVPPRHAHRPVATYAWLIRKKQA